MTIEQTFGKSSFNNPANILDYIGEKFSKTRHIVVVNSALDGELNFENLN